MKLRHWISGGLLARRLVRSLDRMAGALEQQNLLLARLADHFCPPVVAPPQPKDLRAELSAISHLDVDEAYLAQEYIGKTERQTGYSPSEDEVLIYLADEKTQVLHERLQQRSADVTAIEDRRAGRTL
jgi:hypothetical protein